MKHHHSEDAARGCMIYVSTVVEKPPASQGGAEPRLLLVLP